jgi:hypothetical protein
MSALAEYERVWPSGEISPVAHAAIQELKVDLLEAMNVLEGVEYRLEKAMKFNERLITVIENIGGPVCM